MNDEQTAGANMDMTLVQRFIWQMSSVVINTIRNFWLSGSDSDHALNECFQALRKVMDGHDQLELHVLAETLKVNGNPVLLKDTIMQSLVQHMEQYSIQHFIIHQGINLEQFAALIAIIVSRDDKLSEAGGFSDMLERYGVENVTAKNIIYRAISEEEVVLQRKQLLKQQLELEEKVRTYLGGTGEGDKEFFSGFAAMSDDSGKMAGLVLDAAAQGTGSGAGVTPERVVECLKRAFDALMNDESFSTPTGKKKLGTALRGLEKEMLSMLEQGEGDYAEGCIDALKDAAGRLKSDAKVQALASEYMKKRESIEQSEKRLLRFMKSVGLDKINDSTLEQRLSEEGLDIEGWRALLGKSVIQSDDMLSNASDKMKSIDSVGNLAQLLANLDQVAEAQGDVPAVTVAESLADVRQDINQKAVLTKIKINTLAKELGADEAVIQRIQSFADSEAQAMRMSRRKMISLVAEIVQELYQPLVVIQAINDMLVSGKLGDVADDQRSMVELSRQSADRLEYLINELVKIAGAPDTLKPDLISMGIVPSEGSTDRELLSPEEAEDHKEVP